MAVSTSRRIVFGHRIALGLFALLGTSCLDPNAFKFGSGEGPFPGDSTQDSTQSSSPENEPSDTKATPEDDSSSQDEGEPTKPKERPEREVEPETGSEPEGSSDSEDTQPEGSDSGDPQDPDDDTEDPEPEDSSEEPDDSTEPEDSDDSGDSSVEPEEPERERGPKRPSEACKESRECNSGACRPIFLQWLRYKVDTSNCAECIDHQDCIDSNRGIACVPLLETGPGNLARAHYACAKGRHGDLCEDRSHCGGFLMCGNLLPEDRRLPKLPFKTCGECISDADCKDSRFPKCQVNTGVPPRLPAHNICARR